MSEQQAPEWARLAQDGHGFWTTAAAWDNSPKYIREDIVAAELTELRTKVAFLEEKLNFVRELGMSFSRDAKEAQDRATLLEQTIQNGAEMILAAHARAEAAEAERDRLEADLKEIGLEPIHRKGFTRVVGSEEITPTAPSSTTEPQT